jgi:hypothetical protein
MYSEKKPATWFIFLFSGISDANANSFLYFLSLFPNLSAIEKKTLIWATRTVYQVDLLQKI